MHMYPPEVEGKKGKHLTWEDRHKIQKGLTFGKNAIDKIGLEIILADDICLKPELLK